VISRRYAFIGVLSLLVLGFAHTASASHQRMALASPHVRLSASHWRLHAQLYPGTTTVAVTADLATNRGRDGYYIDYGRSPGCGRHFRAFAPIPAIGSDSSPSGPAERFMARPR
jgi:hypothetical protein